MIITKDNFKEFTDTDMRLDISCCKRRVTGIEYLPASIKILHLGGHPIPSLPDLPHTLRYLSSYSKKLHTIGKLPTKIKMVQLDQCRNLPKYMRIHVFDFKNSSIKISDINALIDLKKFISKID
jgi:hypothetical protein